VSALAVSGSTVYLGGFFNGANSINGTLTRNRLAAVDGTTGTATGWDPNPNNGVRALASDGGGGVVAGGIFDSLELAAQQGIASFSNLPSNGVRPKVSGIAKVGKKLACSRGTWAGSPPLSFGFRWLRGGVAIAGASASSYTVKPADSGRKLSCRVTARNLAGSVSATSAAVKVKVECIVPALKGRKLAAAKSAIRAAHCKVGKVTKKKSAGKAGRVLSQRPTPGTRRAPGSKVALVVSKH
jgi:hypothetical protein